MFLVSSIDYDYSNNCNRLRLTITITPCLLNTRGNLANHWGFPGLRTLLMKIRTETYLPDRHCCCQIPCRLQQ